jgi:hypothetical protein
MDSSLDWVYLFFVFSPLILATLGIIIVIAACVFIQSGKELDINRNGLNQKS